MSLPAHLKVVVLAFFVQCFSHHVVGEVLKRCVSYILFRRPLCWMLLLLLLLLLRGCRPAAPSNRNTLGNDAVGIFAAFVVPIDASICHIRVFCYLLHSPLALE